MSSKERFADVAGFTIICASSSTTTKVEHQKLTGKIIFKKNEEKKEKQTIDAF